MTEDMELGDAAVESEPDPKQQALDEFWNRAFEAGRKQGIAEGVKAGLEQGLKAVRDFLDTVNVSVVSIAPKWIGDNQEDTLMPFAAPVEQLALMARTENLLKQQGICTVGELLAKSEKDLLDIRNFGGGSLDDVKSQLAMYNYRLARARPRFVG